MYLRTSGRGLCSQSEEYHYCFAKATGECLMSNLKQRTTLQRQHAIEISQYFNYLFSCRLSVSVRYVWFSTTIVNTKSTTVNATSMNFSSEPLFFFIYENAFLM